MLINENWRDGLATSIAAVLGKLLEQELPQNVIFAACNKPLSSATNFVDLVYKRKQTELGIVCSAYGKM